MICAKVFNTNSGASGKYKLEEEPDQPQTPLKPPPPKSRDIKDTAVKDPDYSPIQALIQDFEGFFATLWPLLEAEFDTWIENVVEQSVSKKVKQAVDSYVSFAKFRRA